MLIWSPFLIHSQQLSLATYFYINYEKILVTFKTFFRTLSDTIKSKTMFLNYVANVIYYERKVITFCWLFLKWRYTVKMYCTCMICSYFSRAKFKFPFSNINFDELPYLFKAFWMPKLNSLPFPDFPYTLVPYFTDVTNDYIISCYPKFGNNPAGQTTWMLHYIARRQEPNLWRGA